MITWPLQITGAICSTVADIENMAKISTDFEWHFTHNGQRCWHFKWSGQPTNKAYSIRCLIAWKSNGAICKYPKGLTYHWKKIGVKIIGNFKTINSVTVTIGDYQREPYPLFDYYLPGGITIDSKDKLSVACSFDWKVIGNIQEQVVLFNYTCTSDSLQNGGNRRQRRVA